MSYTDDDHWYILIKDQTGFGGFHLGPRIVIFSSYGSPTGGPIAAVGSTLGYLGPQQRVSIKPSIVQYSPRIALFYNREEFDDVVSRYCRNDRFLINLDNFDNTAHDYMFELTNGHPGAVDGVLRMLEKVCFPTLPA